MEILLIIVVFASYPQCAVQSRRFFFFFFLLYIFMCVVDRVERNAFSLNSTYHKLVQLNDLFVHVYDVCVYTLVNVTEL